MPQFAFFTRRVRHIYLTGLRYMPDGWTGSPYVPDGFGRRSGQPSAPGSNLSPSVGSLARRCHVGRTRFRSKGLPYVRAFHICCMCVYCRLKDAGSHRLLRSPTTITRRVCIIFHTGQHIPLWLKCTASFASVCPRCLSRGQGDNR